MFNPQLLGVAWLAIHEVPFEVVPLYARKAHVRKLRELHFMSPASYQTAGPGGAAPQLEKYWPQRKHGIVNLATTGGGGDVGKKAGSGKLINSPLPPTTTTKILRLI